MLNLDARNYQGSGAWLDSPPSAHEALLVQTPTFVSELPPYFDLEGGETNGGTVDSFSVLDAASLDETSALTVEMWVWLDAVFTTPTMLFSKRSLESDGFVGFVTSTGFTFRFGTGAGAEITWPTPPRLQTWQHLVVTVDATGSHIYNNGGLVASSVYTGDSAALNTGAPLLLGDVNGAARESMASTADSRSSASTKRA